MPSCNRINIHTLVCIHVFSCALIPCPYLKFGCVLLHQLRAEGPDSRDNLFSPAALACFSPVVSFIPRPVGVIGLTEEAAFVGGVIWSCPKPLMGFVAAADAIDTGGALCVFVHFGHGGAG